MEGASRTGARQCGEDSVARSAGSMASRAGRLTAQVSAARGGDTADASDASRSEVIVHELETARALIDCSVGGVAGASYSSCRFDHQGGVVRSAEVSGGKTREVPSRTSISDSRRGHSGREGCVEVGGNRDELETARGSTSRRGARDHRFDLRSAGRGGKRIPSAGWTRISRRRAVAPRPGARPARGCSVVRGKTRKRGARSRRQDARGSFESYTGIGGSVQVLGDGCGRIGGEAIVRTARLERARPPRPNLVQAARRRKLKRTSGSTCRDCGHCCVVENGCRTPRRVFTAAPPGTSAPLAYSIAGAACCCLREPTSESGAGTHAFMDDSRDGCADRMDKLVSQDEPPQQPTRAPDPRSKVSRSLCLVDEACIVFITLAALGVPAEEATTRRRTRARNGMAYVSPTAPTPKRILSNETKTKPKDAGSHRRDSAEAIPRDYWVHFRGASPDPDPVSPLLIDRCLIGSEILSDVPRWFLSCAPSSNVIALSSEPAWLLNVPSWPPVAQIRTPAGADRNRHFSFPCSIRPLLSFSSLLLKSFSSPRPRTFLGCCPTAINASKLQGDPNPPWALNLVLRAYRTEIRVVRLPRRYPRIEGQPSFFARGELQACTWEFGARGCRTRFPDGVFVDSTYRYPSHSFNSRAPLLCTIPRTRL
ncbi:hypothetical protein DFH07DRAFT_980503 [Mycena maculata]|uniref:Uncharacterized protein n=1 Tax=Mycena maculata TaxID=230809 RepID=A0AAD7IFW6_9AGAR|nr:hypothetical protein DFH07DRAFT_980503 [Mycena maculata]